MPSLQARMKNPAMVVPGAMPALLALGATSLTAALVDETLGVLLKYEEDVRAVRGPAAERLLAESAATL